MNEIKSIFVGLDLSPMDKVVFEFLASSRDLFPFLNKLVFLHNISEVDELFLTDDDFDKLTQGIEKDIHQQIEGFQSLSSLDCQIKISFDSSTARVISESAKEIEAQLLVLGKKIHNPGRGRVTLDVLEHSTIPADILLLPDRPKINAMDWSTIVFPTDFSDTSQSTIRRIAPIFKNERPRLLILFAYKMPVTYFPYLKINDAVEHKKEGLKNEIRSFVDVELADLNEKFSTKLLATKNKSVSRAIEDYMEQYASALIVISKTGKGHIEKAFLGSVAAELIRSSLDKAMWISAS